MFLDLFFGLRDEGVPVAIQEWQGFLTALERGLHGSSLLRFYHLGRACLVKSETFFDAYDRARSRLPEPWPLVVVGPQGWGDALRPRPGVVLAGEVPAGILAGLYAGCRCLAYVPLHEGYGLPALEAMAAGAPVVASPMPSTQGAAFEVDPLSVAAIADGLVCGSIDGPTRDGLIAGGRTRVEKLTWESTARRHVALWEQLL